LLKNQCQIEHTRHRSHRNFFVNWWAGIIAYKFLDKKPAIQDYKQEIKKIKLFQDIAA